MAKASQAPLRASVKRSSIEAMRLTSRRFRPERATFAARRAGSKICSFSDKGAGSSMDARPRRAERSKLLFAALAAVAGLVAAAVILGRLAADRTGLLVLGACQINLPVYDLLAALVRGHDDRLHGAQHTLTDRRVFTIRVADGGGFHVPIVGEGQRERRFALGRLLGDRLGTALGGER